MKLVRAMSLMLLATFVLFVGSLFNSAGAQDSTQAGEGCTIVVQADESLQTAVDRAPEGSVLCLSEGTWEETVSIEKTLTVKGLGPERSRVSRFWISSEKTIMVRLERLKLIGSRFFTSLEVLEAARVVLSQMVISSGQERDGIKIRDRALVIIIDSEISETRSSGIVLENSAQMLIVNSEISGNNGSGILLNDSSQATIINAVISENGNGLVLEGSSQAALSNLRISANKVNGLRLRDTSQVTLSDSKISRNSVGVLLSGMSRAIFSGSDDGSTEVYENNSDGIVIQDEARVDMRSLKISRNGGNGILLKGSARATIERSDIKSNDGYGVALYQSPCSEISNTNDIFQGRVFGKDNFIPGPDEVFGNEDGAVCPPGLEFLRTPEGGQYP